VLQKKSHIFGKINRAINLKQFSVFNLSLLMDFLLLLLFFCSLIGQSGDIDMRLLVKNWIFSKMP